MRARFGHKKQSIVHKVCRGNTLVFLAVSLLTLIITLTENVLYHAQKDIHSMDIYNSNAISSMDNMLKDMGRISLICFSDQRTQEALTESGHYDYRQRLALQDYLDSMYVNLISIRGDVKGVYIFDADKLIFMHDQAGPGARKGTDESAFLSHIVEIQDRGRQISGCRMYVGTLPDFRIYSDIYAKDLYYRNNIYLVRPIRRFSPLSTVGYIALRAPVGRVRRIMEERLEEGTSYILFDEFGYVVCSSDAGLIGVVFPEKERLLRSGLSGESGSHIVKYNGSFQLVAGYVSDYSGMSLITMKPVGLVVRELLPAAGISFLISLLIFVMATVSTFLVTRNHLKRVSDFVAEMGNFSQESLTRHYRIDRDDEVGTLQRAYNRMVDLINHLIETEYEEKARMQEAEISEQRMAMEYLKNQINPHFLYNTLDMIQICASLNGDAKVADMLQQMVKFYRLGTRVDRDLVSVDQELQMLRAYMKLMMYRYPELKFETEIDSDLQNIEVPSFILQPLVENSLLHGLKDRHYQGTIRLRVYAVYEESCDLRIVIADDGTGVSEDKLREMNGWNDGDVVYRKEQVVNSRDMHIGIRNVIARLQLYYGKESRVLFENRPEGGLTVTLYMKLFNRRRKTYENAGF
ncbi:sensor histidine kinase [Lachnoclostridium sp. Marseille-P6806]|uniref:sensor histidine kinase n=1 Tax=Lachnoclostridium sp. Marseille-P6806 TaxID=2364793 RepID=UPI00102FAE12|nr:histidine kinase [Lachnoclostridium sp. Marseille-P6806]